MKFCSLLNRKFFVDFGLFFLLWSISFWIRTVICEREILRIRYMSDIEQPSTGTFVPFTIESAMAFNYAKRIALGEVNFLGKDIHLVGMENVDVNRQFNVGIEYFLGYGYRLKKWFVRPTEIKQEDKIYENDPNFSIWARFQLRLWASVSSALIFLILRSMKLPLHIAIFASLLHCFSPAAIARHTGQEIIGEAFTLPFLLFMYASAMWYYRSSSFFTFVLFLIFSFISIATWDMTQVVFSILALLELLRIILGGGSGRKRKRLWFGLSGMIILAAILVPYHLEHKLRFSPLVLSLVPTVLLCQNCFSRKVFTWLRFAKIAAIFIILILFSSYVGKISSYSENYSHFSELIKAKIKYLNVKPLDPAKLNFTARVLWTPAMHSADLRILRSYFPAGLGYCIILLFFIFTTAILSRRFYTLIKFRAGILFLPFSFFLFYFFGFFLIVRYHSFLIVFLCILLAFLIFLLEKFFSKNIFSNKVIRYCLWLGVVLVLVVELLFAFGQERLYEEHFFGETATLIKWFRRENVANKIFLADFKISPILLAYCDAGIVLQPKFELGQTRKKFEVFNLLLYHGTERDLMRFCSENSVDYYVFDKGLAGPMGIYSMRYFANAKHISATSPVGMMSDSQRRKRLRYFYEMKVPPDCRLLENRYIVFKVITDKNSVDALRWTNDAREFYKKGNITMARRLIKAAVYADPNCYTARLLYAEIFNEPADIRLRGF